MDEGRATAILSLQSEACLEALGIDYPALHARACARGLLAARVAVRDFDHDDQAAMLPEAVRALHTLLALGHRVYVHCTAGINRATLTTVGYLTFVQGVGLEEALRAVKQARPQAHPYVDCWRTVRRRLVEGRGDEVGYEARAIFDRWAECVCVMGGVRATHELKGESDGALVHHIWPGCVMGQGHTEALCDCGRVPGTEQGMGSMLTLRLSALTAGAWHAARVQASLFPDASFLPHCQDPLCPRRRRAGGGSRVGAGPAALTGRPPRRSSSGEPSSARWRPPCPSSSPCRRVWGRVVAAGLANHGPALRMTACRGASAHWPAPSHTHRCRLYGRQARW